MGSLFQIGLDDLEHDIKVLLPLLQFGILHDMIGQVALDDGSHQAIASSRVI